MMEQFFFVLLKNMTFSEILAHIIAILVIGQFFVFLIWKRREVLPDLRGKDKVWQFLELSGIVWLLIFPPMVIISGLGHDYPSGAWATMDIVYFINVLGKRADKFIEARFGVVEKKEDEKEKEEEQQKEEQL